MGGGNLQDKVLTMKRSINQSLTFSRTSWSHVTSSEKNIKQEKTLSQQRPTVPAPPHIATSPLQGFSDL